MNRTTVAVTLAGALLMVSPFAGAGPQWPPKAVGASQKTTRVGGIEAGADVQKLLERIRAALGGQKKLLAVHSIAAKGTETFEGSRPSVLERLILLPDRFQQRYRETFFATIERGRFWQVPGAEEPQEAANRARMTRYFVGDCLLFLLRAPGSFPLQASRVASPRPGVVALAFDGADDFHRTIEVDAASMRPLAFSWKSVMTQGDRKFEGLATMTIDEYSQVGGISIPVRTTARQEGVPVAVKYHYSSIRIDEGVTLQDFARPKQ